MCFILIRCSIKERAIHSVEVLKIYYNFRCNCLYQKETAKTYAWRISIKREMKNNNSNNNKKKSTQTKWSTEKNALQTLLKIVLPHSKTNDERQNRAKWANATHWTALFPHWHILNSVHFTLLFLLSVFHQQKKKTCKIIFCFVVAFPSVTEREKKANDHEYEMKYVFCEKLGEKIASGIFIWCSFGLCLPFSCTFYPSTECVVMHSSKTENGECERNKENKNITKIIMGVFRRFLFSQSATSTNCCLVVQEEKKLRAKQ